MNNERMEKKKSQHTREKKNPKFCKLHKIYQKKMRHTLKTNLRGVHPYHMESKSRLYKQGFDLLHYHIPKNCVKPFNTNHHIFSFEGLFRISAKFPSFGSISQN
jgi:Golgi nucleoside diphosphatase